MKPSVKWIVSAAVAATSMGMMGTANAADVRLGLNTGFGLGCQVAGVRAGLQEGRFGGFIQGVYCSSNVQGVAGGVSLGGALTFDVYQSQTVGAYLLAGANTNSGTDASLFAGAGVRYGIPLFPVEGYAEAGVQRTNTLLGPVVGPRVAVGVNYVFRGVDLSASSAASGTVGSGESSAPAQCNISASDDAANAASAAQSAMQSAVQAGASAYAGIYRDISPNISVGSTSVSGNNATVSGSISFSAVQVSNGQSVSGTYGGTVNLVRSGCGWQTTGYTQNS
ncbi:hypothetical protein [Deinococcus puniceus]|uniref:Uncharacterized protein n=1 Tax=Deinococcus puniceus TaxID=1182568 RepID=A0A172TAR7_9DEIO|nr:hypothetical protein [Deinococcus puniceus]ANE44091.1 hypothetical protein SU48_10240 [Deinococcus puniceus]